MKRALTDETRAHDEAPGARPRGGPREACLLCRAEVGLKHLAKATVGGRTESELVECPRCGARYLWPMPTAEDLADLYGAAYHGSDWYKQQGWGMAFARAVLNRLPAGRFLDVGCGMGFFIDAIRRHSRWEVHGVEFGRSAAEYARRELGLDVRAGELIEANFPERYFDYVQVRNVLEHVTDPLALLRECRRILKPGGTLHLFVPNGLVDSLDLIRFYESEGRAAFSKSGHLYFFPPRTLLWMFAETGLELVRARTYGIRRGLASMGLWPRFKDWKKHYVVKRPAAAAQGETQIVLPPKKNRPDLYYLYRLHRMNLRMLPGMREFGLDYELLLKPKS